METPIGNFQLLEAVERVLSFYGGYIPNLALDAYHRQGRDRALHVLVKEYTHLVPGRRRLFRMHQTRTRAAIKCWRKGVLVHWDGNEKGGVLVTWNEVLDRVLLKSNGGLERYA